MGRGRPKKSDVPGQEHTENNAVKTDTGAVETIDKSVSAKDAEIEALKKQIAALQKHVKVKIRPEPDSYLVTTNVEAVENLQLDAFDKNTKIRKLKVKQIAPVHITGSSLDGSKKYYYDIADKDNIIKMLGKEGFEKAEFWEQDKVEKTVRANELEDKLDESEDKAEQIKRAKRNLR